MYIYSRTVCDRKKPPCNDYYYYYWSYIFTDRTHTVKCIRQYYVRGVRVYTVYMHTFIIIVVVVFAER